MEKGEEGGSPWKHEERVMKERREERSDVVWKCLFQRNKMVGPWQHLTELQS